MINYDRTEITYIYIYIRFDVHLDPVAGISAPTVSPAYIAKLEKHFMSHRCFTPPKCRIPQIFLCSSLEALNGFMFGVDATKSLILTLACIERVITVDEAVKRQRRGRDAETNFSGETGQARAAVPDRSLGKCRVGSRHRGVRHDRKTGCGNPLCSTLVH